MMCDYCKLQQIRREVRFEGGTITLTPSQKMLKVEKHTSFTVTSYLYDPNPTFCTCGEHQGRIATTTDLKLFLLFLRKGRKAHESIIRKV
jgi:hypothetical protein